MLPSVTVQANLAQTIALDIWGREANAHGGEWLLLLSRDFYLLECLQRFTGVLTLITENAPEADFCREAFLATGSSATLAIVKRTDLAELCARSYAGILIAGANADLLDLWRTLSTTIAPQRPPLYILYEDTLLATVLRRLGRGKEPVAGREGFSFGVLSRILDKNAYRSEREASLHTIRSIGWSLLGRAARLNGRDDWADRAHFNMRACYVVYGHSLYATLRLIIATPTKYS